MKQEAAKPRCTVLKVYFLIVIIVVGLILILRFGRNVDGGNNVAPLAQLDDTSGSVPLDAKPKDRTKDPYLLYQLNTSPPKFTYFLSDYSNKIGSNFVNPFIRQKPKVKIHPHIGNKNRGAVGNFAKGEIGGNVGVGGRHNLHDLDALADDAQIFYKSNINVDYELAKYVYPVDIPRSLSLPQKKNKPENLLDIGELVESLPVKDRLSVNEQIINYFDEHRRWIGSKMFQVPKSPFDEILDFNDMIDNYDYYSKQFIPTRELYSVSINNVIASWDNEYSPLLGELAKKAVGESCWNKKLVIYSDHFHMFHKGGPRKVGTYLINALKLIGKEFIVTDDWENPVMKEADFIYSFSPYRHVEFLSYILGYLKSGQLQKDAKIVVGPVVHSEIFREYFKLLGNRLIFLTASHWVKALEFDPLVESSGASILVHPTPINTKLWSPSTSFPKTKRDILLYSKGCNFANKIESYIGEALKKNGAFDGAKLHVIDYSSQYSEAYFYDMLKEKIALAVVCDNSETQGIALLVCFWCFLCMW